MLRIQTIGAAAVLTGILIAGSAYAATSGTQSNSVTVSSVLSITAPAAASITHDGTDTNQTLAAQTWSISQNQVSGATATFSVSAPFVHATATSVKRDCKLALAISSSEAAAGWSVTTANDQTAYAAATPDNAASVTAASTGAGNADLSLTVTFLNSDYSTLPQGTYSTTVTGTITAN